MKYFYVKITNAAHLTYMECIVICSGYTWSRQQTVTRVGHHIAFLLVPSQGRLRATSSAVHVMHALRHALYLRAR